MRHVRQMGRIEIHKNGKLIPKPKPDHYTEVYLKTCRWRKSLFIIAVILPDFTCDSRVCTYADELSAAQYGPLFGWLVSWLCLTSHRQRGHLEMAPPFIVPCKGCEAR